MVNPSDKLHGGSTLEFIRYNRTHLRGGARSQILGSALPQIL